MKLCDICVIKMEIIICIKYNLSMTLTCSVIDILHVTRSVHVGIK